MGHLTYDGNTVQFDDRVLTHLQIVIVQKLRRNESFLMSWRDSPDIGDGRGSMWISPAVPMYFKFLGGKVPQIDEEWLLVLGKSAESSTGLIVTYADGEYALAGATNGKFPGTG